MNRELALVRLLLVLLVAVVAIAGCTILGVSTLPPAVPDPTATVPDTATVVPPTATATTLPVVAAIAVEPSPVPPTETAVPTNTPVPPTDTPVPTATKVPPTATIAPKAPTAKPATATATSAATQQPATATKQPTAKPATPTATKPPTSSSRAVGLDPGHHILDQGGDSTLVGIPEYKLTMETALAVKRYLSGYTVRLSRTGTGPVSCWCASDSTVRIQREQEARIRAVGVVGVYVPIHFNASPSNMLKGTEAYYNVDQVGVAARSKTLAQLLASNVVSRVRAAGYEAVNRGARSDLLVGKSYGHYFGLRGPYPASLVESLYMDQKDDAAALRDPKIRDAIAHGIADAIKAFLR